MIFIQFSGKTFVGCLNRFFSVKYTCNQTFIFICFVSKDLIRIFGVTQYLQDKLRRIIFTHTRLLIIKYL